MFAQQQPDRRRFLGVAALSLAGAWIGTRDSVMHMLTVKPFRSSSASDLASLGGATAWLNSPPLKAADLQGKVVLVDFWTYTCINWLRTVPYVRAWAKERGVTYPIAIDNDRAIWSGFGNHYWPALYFIDASGRVRDHHFGEGNYEESETRIRQLLAAAGRGAGIDGESVPLEAHGPEVGADWSNLKSPETYVGHQKAENFASPGGAAVNSRHLYAVPPRLRLNQWALSGQWTLQGEAAVLNTAGGRIGYRFHARDLHLIMGPAAHRGAVRFRVLIDGQPASAGHGSDVDDQGNGTVTEQRLYQLIRQTGPIVERQFEIEFLDSGVEAFAFTFG